MVSRKSSSVKGWRCCGGFTSVLTSAVQEWLLLFLLFLNGLFSYLVTRLARLWELETPCLLCSRLDHLLGHEKPGFYWDLTCSAHKFEISSLVFCHAHNKLADVHGLCEGCLLSFATEKKSNSETYRLLVGTLGTEFECCDNQDHLLKDPASGFSSKRHCSCCNEPWKLRLDAHRLLQPVGPEAAVLNVDLPATVEKKRVHLYDGLKKSREKICRELSYSLGGCQSSDPLSHPVYSELKIASDSESEVPFCDDDDDRDSLVHIEDNLKEDTKDQNVQLGLCTAHTNVLTLSGSLTSEEQVYEVFVSEPSPLVPQAQHDLGESHDFTFSAPAAVDGQGLEDLNWQVEEKTDPSPVPELISNREFPFLSNVQVEEKADSSPVPENHGIPYSSIVGENLVETSTELSNFSGANVLGPEPIMETEKTMIESGSTTITAPGTNTDQMVNDRSPPMTNLMDLSDAYELVVSNKGKQVSNLPEQLTMKDSTRVSEDLKLWLSQISSPRGLDLPFSDLSPRPHVQREYLKTSDPSCSIGLQILQKRISLERNESGFESLDGSIVSEIEGESLVDRLKRQVEYDRKSMNSLYKELEEERNASAVAANQALAMITRLQEEKATLQMDALQYLRMMEEQAEYDVDALQKANELLAEKEQKGQDLEAELELYRGRISCEAMVEKVQVPTCDSKGGRRMEHLDVSRLIHTINTPCNTPREYSQCTRRPDKTDVVNGNTHTRITTASLVGFEDERSYILQCLEKLEKKLRLFSNNGLHFPIDGNFIKEESAVNHLGRSEGNSQREEDSFPEQNDSSAHPPDQEKHTTTAHQNLTNDKYSPDCEWEDIETHIVALEHEFFYLNERLKALEADRNILEHTINSLQTGDGIHFIQEIAQDLRELRKVGIRRDQTIV